MSETFLVITPYLVPRFIFLFFQGPDFFKLKKKVSEGMNGDKVVMKNGTTEIKEGAREHEKSQRLKKCKW